MLCKWILIPGLIVVGTITAAQEKAATSPNANPSPASSVSPSQAAQQTSPSITLPDSAKLEVLTRVPAEYPPEARAGYLQGRVIIKFNISKAGDVETAEVVRGPVLIRRTVLDEAALNAAKQWKFKPYIRNGEPVPVTTTIPFDFKLDGQIPDWGTPDLPHKIPGPAGRGLTLGKPVHRVQPIYPLKAKLQGVTGSVLLDAVIGNDGNIRFLHVVQGQPILAQAAVDAVKQWKYTPYMLNGEATNVDTQITVNFTLN